MCAVHAEHDPAKAQGLGGQVPVRESASVNFTMSAYIRELGYQATVRRVNSVDAAVATGIGTRGPDGRLVTTAHGTHVYVSEGILTDLPLSVGSPKL